MFGINLIISLLFFISIIAIGIFIQVKLSRSKNKYLGLIIPVISFLLSIIMVLGMGAYTSMSTLIPGDPVEITETKDETTGEIIEESMQPREETKVEDNLAGLIIGMFFTFLIANIPTVILGGIYISERNKIDVNKAIEKMKIEDL